METFAERFCKQNPHVFPSVDTAFILGFSVIMLNTDLHNPAIKPKRRMTKEVSVRNNGSICDGKSLPDEFLIAIYDRIQKNRISLKEDDAAREKTDIQADGTREFFFGNKQKAEITEKTG
jgi:brefeldin A-inhibited guanine nucleotide-exchange protein